LIMQVRRCVYFLAILFLPTLTCAQTASTTDVAVYFDEGAWEDGVLAFESFLDWKGLSHERVNAKWINSNDLHPRFKVVYFPGGYAYDYKRKLTAAGERHIRELVDAGGGYVGICAGAFFAATRVDWEGGSYPYTLGLFKGRAFGALSEIASWPDYALTTISLNPRHEVSVGLAGAFTTMYFGGPAFYPDPDEDVDTLATWDEYNAHPAIITLHYGQGRVLLIGPHPEIEENSARDGNLFGSALNDPETEWGLLWRSMDWVLKHPISDTTLTTGISADTSLKPAAPAGIMMYPNPANSMVNIITGVNSPAELEICDLLGQSRIRAAGASGLKLSVNVRDLPTGLYIAKIVFSGELRLQLLRIQR
jgi:glutamine amidotransferase-like uncharacterized protein